MKNLLNIRMGKCAWKYCECKLKTSNKMPQKQDKVMPEAVNALPFLVVC